MPLSFVCSGYIGKSKRVRKIVKAPRSFVGGARVFVLIADRGYLGEKYPGKTQLLIPSPTSPADTEYKKRNQRKRFRKRAGIEATISHLKHDFRLGRRFLKGEIRDRISVSLSTVA